MASLLPGIARGQSGDRRTRKKQLVRLRCFSSHSSAAMLQHHSRTIEPAKSGTVSENVFPAEPSAAAAGAEEYSEKPFGSDWSGV